jgi:hypothetical protein
MDPDNPVRYRAGGMTLTQVQMWIMSTLAVITIMHFAAGLIASAIWLTPGRTGAQVWLNVLAGVTGVVAVAAARGIHRKSIVSGWLALGLLIIPIGLFLTFWI